MLPPWMGPAVGNEFVLLLHHHGELLQQVVVHALTHAHLGADHVLEGPQREGQCWEALISLCEELASLLDLEQVHLLELALVHS